MPSKNKYSFLQSIPTAMPSKNTSYLELPERRRCSACAAQNVQGHRRPATDLAPESRTPQSWFSEREEATWPECAGRASATVAGKSKARFLKASEGWKTGKGGAKKQKTIYKEAEKIEVGSMRIRDRH